MAREEFFVSIADRWSKSTWSLVPAIVLCSFCNPCTIDEAFLIYLFKRDVFQLFYCFNFKIITSNLLHLFQENKEHDQEGQNSAPKEFCLQICRIFCVGTGTEQQSKLEQWQKKLEQSFCHTFFERLEEFCSLNLINFTFQQTNKKLWNEIWSKILANDTHRVHFTIQSQEVRNKTEKKTLKLFSFIV